MDYVYSWNPLSNSVLFVFIMACVGDFTLVKDEASGGYHVDTSQKSTRHIRATVKIYE